MSLRDEIAAVVLNHWCLELPAAQFPTMVKCMADGCGWTGRFPGDISEHNADLIMEVIEAHE